MLVDGERGRHILECAADLADQVYSLLLYFAPDRTGDDPADSDAFHAFTESGPLAAELQLLEQVRQSLKAKSQLMDEIEQVGEFLRLVDSEFEESQALALDAVATVRQLLAEHGQTPDWPPGLSQLVIGDGEIVLPAGRDWPEWDGLQMQSAIEVLRWYATGGREWLTENRQGKE